MKIISYIAVVMALITCFAGCAQKTEAPAPTDGTQATSPSSGPQTTDPTETTATQKEAPSLNGLSLRLDDSFTYETESNTLTFTNGQIHGTVDFGPLDQLTGGNASTSKEYAEHLEQTLGPEMKDAWIGTSNGMAYYIVLESAEKAQVQCLYTYGTFGWLVQVESTDPGAIEDMTPIAGRCYF